ncbi:MAG: hypothetical protein ACK4SX_14350 [Alcanivoracaceae bacterium]
MRQNSIQDLRAKKGIMEALNEFCSVTKAYAPWLAIILVAFGWLVSHWTANSRESRKEIRSAIDRFSVNCRELWETAKDYHTASTHCSNTACKVKSLLSQLSIIIPYCESLGISDQISKDITALRQEVTLKNFDAPSSFSSVNIKDPRLTRISGSMDILLLSIEQAFAKKYHNGRKNKKA